MHFDDTSLTSLFCLTRAIPHLCVMHFTFDTCPFLQFPQYIVTCCTQAFWSPPFHFVLLFHCHIARLYSIYTYPFIFDILHLIIHSFIHLHCLFICFCAFRTFTILCMPSFFRTRVRLFHLHFGGISLPLSFSSLIVRHVHLHFASISSFDDILPISIRRCCHCHHICVALSLFADTSISHSSTPHGDDISPFVCC